MAWGGYGGGYGAPGGGYGAPPAYDPYAGYGGPGGGYGAPVEEIRTLFITGFPDDIQERELNNLLRFIPGYVASQMNWKNGQAQGFALFESLAACSAACAQLNSVLYDEAPPGFKLRAEVARKNMHALNDPVVPGGVKRQRFNDGGFGAPPPSAAPGGYGRPPPSYPPPGGYGGAPGGGYGGSAGGAPTFSVFTADDGPVAPVQPIAFRPVENSNDNPPCSTLFVGNLADNVNELELKGVFGPQPGFRQLKVVRNTRAVTAFVEYDTVEQAQAVHGSLQGAVLPSSDRGGMRIQFSKNPFGRRVG